MYKIIEIYYVCKIEFNHGKSSFKKVLKPLILKALSLYLLYHIRMESKVISIKKKMNFGKFLKQNNLPFY